MDVERAAARAGRGRRVLPRRRGADQRRALRGGDRARAWRSGARTTTLVVLVADDGVGGVDPSAGGGLRGLDDRVATVGGTLDDRQPDRRRHAAAGEDPGAGHEASARPAAALLVAGRLRRDDRRARAGRRRSPARRARSPAPGAPVAGRRGADRGRHARPGLEQVLGDHPQRRRLRRAPARRARRLPVARRLQRRADERADRPGGRDQARRARGLDPVRRPGAGDPARRAAPASRSSRSTPAATSSATSACSRTSGQVEDRAGLEAGRRLADAGVRRALCLNQEAGNAGVDARCAGLAKAMREAGGSARVLADRRRRPAHAGADRRAPSKPTAPTACWPPTRSAGWPRPRALAGTGVKIGTFDLGPGRAEGRRGGPDRLRRRPAGLPAGLPADRDARPARALRDPARRSTTSSPRARNFVTRGNAAQALELSERSIR